MKHTRFPLCALVFASALLLASPAAALDLDSFRSEINVTAHADIGGFRADLSATFGLSSGEIDGLLEICDSPGDVYIALRVGEVAHVPVDRVITEYRAHKGQGWGAIAKNLGIKPGSAEFHALKDGRFAAHTADASSGNGKSSNKGKGRK